MRHVNYPRWAQYVIDLFRLASGRPVERVLELACGTGKMLAQLARAGYIVYGLDSSFAMVKLAANRLAEEKQAANGQWQDASHKEQSLACNLPLAPCPLLWCGDMRNCAIASPVDAAICLYDSFNYCLEPRDAGQLLDSVARAVRPGGLFIFDVCTQRNCRNNFRNYYERDGLNEFSYIRRSYFRPYRKMQINEFIITDERSPTSLDSAAKGKSGPIYERHEQRIYLLREIRSLIDPEQWSVAGCFDGMSRRPGTERSDRVHFVLRRL